VFANSWQKPPSQMVQNSVMWIDWKKATVSGIIARAREEISIRTMGCLHFRANDDIILGPSPFTAVKTQLHSHSDKECRLHVVSTFHWLLFIGSARGPGYQAHPLHFRTYSQEYFTLLFNRQDVSTRTAGGETARSSSCAV